MQESLSIFLTQIRNRDNKSKNSGNKRKIDGDFIRIKHLLDLFKLSSILCTISAILLILEILNKLMNHKL